MSATVSLLRRSWRRGLAAYRRETSLWERYLAWPPADGSLQWVKTVDGWQLRGWLLPNSNPDPSANLRGCRG